MKKIQLSIPQPCHENWDAMTQAEKGRFCASCQKTVMDFTNMSDRQLAEFFKKPPSSVCGRFYQDQLEKDIEIPRKRIPWIRYFFQISFPAFLVSMKATAQGKVSVKGDTVVLPRSYKTTAKNAAASVNSLKKVDKTKAIPALTKHVEFPNLLGMNEDPVATIPEIKLTPVGREACLSEPFTGAVGGVVLVSVRTNYPLKIIKDTTVRVKRVIETVLQKFSIYPNPAQRNSPLKLSLKKMDAGQYTVSIINLSGEIVQTKEVFIENKKQVLDFRLKDIAAGTYFFHLFNRKTAVSFSEKIIVQ